MHRVGNLQAHRGASRRQHMVRVGPRLRSHLLFYAAKTKGDSIMMVKSINILLVEDNPPCRA